MCIAAMLLACVEGYIYICVLLAFAQFAFAVINVNCIVRVPHMQGPSYIDILLLKGATLCVVENEALTSLNSKASDRVQLAFRPKTRKAYTTMFRTFIAFCIVTKSCIVNVNVKMVLSFLESHNVITIPILIQISQSCEALDSRGVYRTAILLGFFAFMRLSNLAPHALGLFDETRHLTGEDVMFTEDHAKVIIKWSKTIQTRDRIQCVTLPKLRNKIICPHRALRVLFRSY